MTLFQIPDGPPRPPSTHLKLSGLHFLREYDSNSRLIGYQVMQWLPGSESWCLPGRYFLAEDALKEGNKYEYVSPCLPPLELEELVALIRLTESAVRIEGSEDVRLQVNAVDWSKLSALFKQLMP